MARKRSMKGKGSYAEYKTDGRALKNKIKKLERHCKQYPDDELSQENLERIKKNGYQGRSRPLVPGSNPTVAKVVLPELPQAKTAGEQLSELLGIPLPKPRNLKRIGKPIIKHKPRKK